MTADPLNAIHDRLAGGLIGLLVGDALGVPYEFHLPSDLPPSDAIEFRPPQGFTCSHFGVPPGTWSDDGAHALILLDSLLDRQSLDLDHFASGLQRWLNSGFCAVNGSVFDIGVQTSTAINRLKAHVSPERSGPDGEHQNGNGSLMRVLSLALWHTGSDEGLVVLAMRQSLPTHGHVRSQLACAMYCLWARAVLNSRDNPWHDAEARLRTLVTGLGLPSDELELVLDPANAASAYGSGYVLDTLWSAKSAVENTRSYQDCVRAAVSLGHDTDTTAAVAGGIAGLKYGLGRDS